MRAQHLAAALAFLATTPALAQTPTLGPAQIQSAIAAGSQYRGGGKYFTKALKGTKVSLSRYSEAVFFDDWHDIALRAADARFREAELRPTDVQPTGKLHAILVTRVTLGFLSPDWGTVGAADGILRGTNLVLEIGGKKIQPAGKRALANQGSSVYLAFDFDVEPEDLKQPITVISIDGDDGRRHAKKADLSAVLNQRTRVSPDHRTESNPQPF
jgi:hypothetical protein